jgi:hypothetical protein
MTHIVSAALDRQECVHARDRMCFVHPDPIMGLDGFLDGFPQRTRNTAFRARLFVASGDVRGYLPQMAIVILCPKCKTRLTLGDDRVGTTFECPRCDGPISVPIPLPPEPIPLPLESSPDPDDGDEPTPPRRKRRDDTDSAKRRGRGRSRGDRDRDHDAESDTDDGDEPSPRRRKRSDHGEPDPDDTDSAKRRGHKLDWLLPLPDWVYASALYIAVSGIVVSLFPFTY